MADYAINFTGSQNPFSDQDWTDIKSNFQKLSGELIAGSSGVSAKMVATGVDPDPLADEWLIELTLGGGQSTWHDTIGCLLVVPPGHPSGDAGKGFWLRKNRYECTLRRIDDPSGAPLGTHVASMGSSQAWSEDDKFAMRITDPDGASPVITLLRNGATIPGVSSQAVSSYIQDCKPGIIMDPQSSNRTGVKTFEFTGTAASGGGSYTITDVNGDNKITNNQQITINGDFSGVTITSVALSQPSAAGKTLNISSQNDTTVVCDAFDALSGTGLYPTNANMIITLNDGTTEKTLGGLAIVFPGKTFSWALNSSVGGLFQGNTVATPFMLFNETEAGSQVQLGGPSNEPNDRLALAPAVPQGTVINGHYMSLVEPWTWDTYTLTVNQQVPQGSKWNLEVNADGTQDMLYPDGGKPSGSAPGAVSGLSVEVLGSDQLRANHDTISGADKYNYYISTDNVSFGFSGDLVSPPRNFSNLDPATTYYIKVSAENEFGEGPLSAAVSATTDQVVVDPGSAIFYDNFEGHEIGKRLNSVDPASNGGGGKWTSVTGSSPDEYPRIVSGGYNGSSKALGFPFKHIPASGGAGAYAWSEQRFALLSWDDRINERSTIDEIWIEMYVYWPTDYDPYDGHEKRIFLWRQERGYSEGFNMNAASWTDGGRTQTSLSPSTERTNYGFALENWASPPFAINKFNGWNFYNPYHAYGSGNKGPEYDFWNKDRDNGKWRRYRWHIKGSAQEDPNDPNSALDTGALYRCWKDNTLVAEITNFTWAREAGEAGIDVGYLMGWMQAGLRNDVVIKIDEVSFWTTNPNWTF